MIRIWYAVQRDREDDWGYGSYDRAEAMKLAVEQSKDYPDTLIAVIKDCQNPVCIGEIPILINKGGFHDDSI